MLYINCVKLALYFEHTFTALMKCELFALQDGGGLLLPQTETAPVCLLIKGKGREYFNYLHVCVLSP